MTYRAVKHPTDALPLIQEERTGKVVAIMQGGLRHDNPSRLFDEAKLLAAAPALLSLVDDARRFIDEGDPEACYWLARADTLLGEL
jgi:hypothetical protein